MFFRPWLTYFVNCVSSKGMKYIIFIIDISLMAIMLCFINIDLVDFSDIYNLIGICILLGTILTAIFLLDFFLYLFYRFLRYRL